MNLCIPGPTRCPPQVLEACSRAMINHRGLEFSNLLERVTEKFKKICRTDNDVFFLTSSGTGAMEAAVVNFLSPGDPILVLSNGHFGERFSKIAKSHRAYIAGELLNSPESAIDPERLEYHLRNIKNIKAVLLVHNETSTGVTNDLETLAKMVKRYGKLLMVDAMSSLGAIPVKIDEWGVDVVITASQKAFMCPPGLSMVVVSPEAWQAHERATMPRYYFDLTKACDSLVRGLTSWTPALSIFYALDTALDLMLQEGMKNVFERHKILAQKARNHLQSLGLELFAKEERYASSTVTAFKIPSGIREDEWVKRLAEEYDTVIGRGQGEMIGHILRISHMGWVDDKYIDDVLAAITASYYDLSRGASRCCR